MWPSKALHGLASAQISTVPLCHSSSVLLQIPGTCWALFCFSSQPSSDLSCTLYICYCICLDCLFPALSWAVSLSLRYQDEGSNVTSSEGLSQTILCKMVISCSFLSIYFLSDHPISLTTACLSIFTCLLCIGNIAAASLPSSKSPAKCLVLTQDYTGKGVLGNVVLARLG